ncbi:hypothetical protein J5A61_01665 [Arachnia propionica]|uniref:hypothetical protein n=1 Tax=Arachnia propionica TaxID=1750 RepID=UPI001BAC8BB0|nr:hypothetical protein [Arachnia propionica]QUC14487.1 hypothetical protein J5A61_01665 [Arachnia propionica]
MKSLTPLTRFIAAALLLAFSLAACSRDAGTRFTSLTDTSDVSDLVSAPSATDPGWTVDLTDKLYANLTLPTSSGPILLFHTSRPAIPDDSTKEATVGTTTLVSLNPDTGSVRWARTLGSDPVADTADSDTHQSLLDSSRKKLRHSDDEEAGYATVSPNGRYLAIQARAHMVSEKSTDPEDQHVGIVVLDTGTGNEVRTVEVSGIVLAHALTDDSLVVETAQNFFPAGSGTLTLFPLGDTRAEPTTLRTDQWLAGTTHDSLLLAPNELTELRWDYLPTPCTVTRLSTTGETLGTVTGARVVLPGGWVERFKDPEAAATTLAQESSASGVATELVHVETGTIIDATGFRVSAETLPTGPGIRLYTNTTADEDWGDSIEDRTTYSWFPATPDSTALRTDDMPWITDHVTTDKKQILSREIIHMEKS